MEVINLIIISMKHNNWTTIHKLSHVLHITYVYFYTYKKWGTEIVWWYQKQPTVMRVLHDLEIYNSI